MENGPTNTALCKFLEKLDTLTKEVSEDCKVMFVEKQYSLLNNEAQFSIKVQFREEVIPDAVVEPQSETER